ncbi:hypothetical protein DFJ77DRAFT_214388 [Powellomyces hirtus]|nr:hypothetical protein DFJ77DRAFT_214388 [Powellomyces hirtus]
MASTLPSAANSTAAAATKYSTLIAAVLQLYTTRDPAVQTRILENHYLPTATFEDPLMIVHNTPNIAAQFHSLLSFFTTITAHPGVASNPHAAPTIDAATTVAGHELLVLPNTQTYYREGAKVGPKEILIEANTLLTLDTASGKVAVHKDVWLNKNTDNPAFVKKASGAASSAIFKLFNVGV